MYFNNPEAEAQKEKRASSLSVLSFNTPYLNYKRGICNNNSSRNIFFNSLIIHVPFNLYIDICTYFRFFMYLNIQPVHRYVQNIFCIIYLPCNLYNRHLYIISVHSFTIQPVHLSFFMYHSTFT